MILYRGIAVPTNRASKVIADIRSRGLLPDQGRWRFRFYDLKPLLPELRQRSIVTTADTELEGEMPTCGMLLLMVGTFCIDYSSAEIHSALVQ